MGHFSQQVENIAHLLMQEAVQTEIYPGGSRRMERDAWRLGSKETSEQKTGAMVDCCALYITKAEKVSAYPGWHVLHATCKEKADIL